MTQAIVLGAGMVGVSTALHLQTCGWSVALVDRTGVGMETSYGNAGLIQGEAVEPYGMPRKLRQLWAIARGASNDVRYDLRSLPGHFAPLFRYWWHSAPKRHRRISAAYSQMAAAATREHQALIERASADHLVRREGFRVMERDEEAMAAALADAERVRAEYGVAFKFLSASELAAAEPALKQAGVGAIHWLNAWSVSDPGALTKAYAKSFTDAGGTISIGEALSLRQKASGSWQVDTQGGVLEAEHTVVALGPWSPELLRRFGYNYPMVRKRGYHRHYRCQPTLHIPLLDAANGYVMAPMARGLRITTGAELSAPNAPSTPWQLERAERAARELISLGEPVEVQPWLGTRPCMPAMLPVVGQAPRHKNLWLNFGHGHQGFTLGPVTGRALAELMSGEQGVL